MARTRKFHRERLATRRGRVGGRRKEEGNTHNIVEERVLTNPSYGGWAVYAIPRFDT